ncbi:MAG: flavin reductase [Coriobacteriales bacterium]|jgi:flavin reductase (DIM6/NTAB) family NADH-FMN oxidoreductase RutF
MGFHQISIGECNENFISALHDRYSLVTSTWEGKTNMLTVAWAQVGHLWQMPVATAYIRPSRYTKEFMDKSGRFTMCFFDASHHDDLIYLGRHSGRDEDKLAKTSLHLLDVDGDKIYEEAELALICKTLYVQQIDLSCLLDKTIETTHYAEGNVSYEYIGEIEKVLVND